jgi:hypothetical protein
MTVPGAGPASIDASASPLLDPPVPCSSRSPAPIQAPPSRALSPRATALIRARKPLSQSAHPHAVERRSNDSRGRASSAASSESRFPRIAGREIDLPQDPRQGKSRSVGDERTAVLALSDGAEDTRSLRRSGNGAAGRPVLLLVVRTSGTPVRAVRGDLDPLPRCVVGLAVPRKTRGGRLVRTLGGVQSVPRRSRQAIRRLGAIFSPARELTRPPPGLVLAEEPAGTNRTQKEAHVCDYCSRI